MLQFKRAGAIVVLAATIGLPASAVADGPQDLRSPDTRDAANAAAGHRQDLRSPDAIDAAEGRTPTRTPIVVPVVLRRVEVEPDGFDWGDAGIGAASGLTVLAMTGGMVAITTRRRRGARLRAATS